MAYSTISKSSLYFNTKLHSGTNSTTTVTGVGFQPDMTWWKSRNNVVNHALYDAVRGGSKLLRPNQTNAEETNAAVSAFTSDGVTLTGGDSFTNASGYTYASWNWKANGSGSANTDGSINSTVSVNTTAGFSIVKYTGTGSNATVGHGLGVAPACVIIKCTNDAQNWRVYHRGMDATAPEDYALILNNTTARDNDNTAFNDTAPTSTTFSIGTSATINQNGNIMIAYCFAEKKGYSKFGSYTGNGNADGPFIYTGFKPAFVLIKCSTNAGELWEMFDNKRIGYNPKNNRIYTNESNAEDTSAERLDLLSNGFKIKTTGSHINRNANTFIYMAFAEEPLVANVGASIPATAR